MVTKRTCGLPLICLICGDVARGINFDLMTCMPCKTFFRRHAQKSTVSYKISIRKIYIFYFWNRLNFNVNLMVIVKLQKEQEVLVQHVV